MNYKDQCICGGTEFFKQKFRVFLGYDTQTFRICKKCGTMKMLSAYYNDEKEEYTKEVQHKPHKKSN